MFRGVVSSLSVCLLAGALSACQPTEDPPETAGEPEAIEVQESPVAAPAEAPGIAAGDYCYFAEDDNSTEGASLTIAANGSVSGVHFGTIHNEENAYYAGFDTILTDGQISDEKPVKFNTETRVDGDHQYGTDNWVVTPDLAHPANWPDSPLRTVDCDELETLVYGESEEEN